MLSWLSCTIEILILFFVGSYRKKRITPLTSLDRALKVQCTKALFRTKVWNHLLQYVGMWFLVSEINHIYLLYLLFHVSLWTRTLVHVQQIFWPFQGNCCSVSSFAISSPTFRDEIQNVKQTLESALLCSHVVFIYMLPHDRADTPDMSNPNFIICICVV